MTAGGDKRIAGWGLQPLIRDEHHRHLEPLGRTEDQLLHIARRGVRINPDLQGRPTGPTYRRRPRGFFRADDFFLPGPPCPCLA